MSNIDIRMAISRNNKPRVFVTNSIGVSRRQFCKFLKDEKPLSKQELFNFLDIQSTEPIHPISRTTPSDPNATI